jgi:uncharacterized lipoprotein YmbA
MAAIDFPTLVELLSVLGIGSTLTGVTTWLLTGRKRARVDNSKIVSDMATEAVKVLVGPLTGQVSDLQTQLATCQVRANNLDQHLQQLLSYAILCHELLIGNPAAPVPPPSVLRKSI